MKNPSACAAKSSTGPEAAGAYARSFRKFLSMGTEKEILLEKILHEFRFTGKARLLDIGAGEGAFSIPDIDKATDEFITI